MNNIINAYQNLKGDKYIWLVVALLSMLSVLAVYSSIGSEAYRSRGGDTGYYLAKHFVFIVLGVGMAYMAYQFHYMLYNKIAPLLLMIAIPLLVYTLFFGVELNSASRWVTIPWMNIRFQTSDFAKLALIIYVARSLAVKQDYIKDLKGAFIPIILPIVFVCGLIAPEDLSTAALLFFTCLLMMFIGRVSLKYVLLLIFSGLIMLAILVLVGSYFPEATRLTTWISRGQDFLYNPADVTQVVMSKKAIAEGGLWGVGPGHSIIRNSLPYAYADFIYAIICEEYGMIGGIITVGLYLWLLFRCLSIVTRCPKAFGAILAMGLCLNIVIQAFANIAVSVQLLPATGLTLPLVSMGGTSILVTTVSIGIILSVSRYVEEAEKQKIELEVIESKDASNY